MSNTFTATLHHDCLSLPNKSSISSSVFFWFKTFNSVFMVRVLQSRQASRVENCHQTLVVFTDLSPYTGRAHPYLMQWKVHGLFLVLPPKNNLIMELDSSKLQKVFSEYKGERSKHLRWPRHLVHGIAYIWWWSQTLGAMYWLTRETLARWVLICIMPILSSFLTLTPHLSEQSRQGSKAFGMRHQALGWGQTGDSLSLTPKFLLSFMRYQKW